jgi:hypothetical protein
MVLNATFTNMTVISLAVGLGQVRSHRVTVLGSTFPEKQEVHECIMFGQFSASFMYKTKLVSSKKAPKTAQVFEVKIC